ncbi:Dyggve-Melchior-Clausen syndrome protein-domain-containing protein [Paraphysoderma sedebokerense]|nr:Dyggve-Melchior-Clausen syndrome protein-domain-containing protein [Paraphysoderma sedebokerense]
MNAENYELYLQILKTLMILFLPPPPCINVSSSPNNTNFNHTEVRGPGSILFFNVWLSNLSVYIRPLLRTLLNNFVECVSQPTEYTGLILSTYNYLFSSPQPAESSELSSISSHSIVLFAGLVCCPHFGRVELYSENGFDIPSNDFEVHIEHDIEMARKVVAKISVFDEVLRQIVDSNAAPSLTNYRGLKGRANRSNSIELSFKKLFEEMIRKIQYEECTLLLYLFLLRNSGFRNYALSRTDPDTLLLPLLQLLSSSLASTSNKSSSEASRPSQPTSHTLITLCLLLSLSTDTSYLHSLKDITLPSTPLWYPDRRYSQPMLIWENGEIKTYTTSSSRW